jgi:hypothetical protein
MQQRKSYRFTDVKDVCDLQEIMSALDADSDIQGTDLVKFEVYEGDQREPRVQTVVIEPGLRR